MKISSVILLLLTISNCFSQIINVDSKILSAVSQNLKSKESPNSIIEIRKLDYDIVKASQFLIDSKNVVKLPDSYNEEVYVNRNCTDGERGWTETISTNTVEGSNYTITNSFTSSKTMSFTAGINIAPVNLGGSLSQTLTIGKTQQQSVNGQRTESRSRNISTTVKAKTALFVKIKSTSANLRLPFKVEIVLDGKVLVHREPPPIVPPASLITSLIRQIGIKDYEANISDILSEPERTFQIEGFIDNAKSMTIDVSYLEKKLEGNECEEKESQKFTKLGDSYNMMFSAYVMKVENSESINKAEIRDFKAATKKELSYKSVHLEKHEQPNDVFNLVIEEYSGSTTITTDDVVAAIEVQHSSFGPGFCNVITRTPSGSVGVNAPPFIWSGWQTVVNHLGVITTTLTNEVNCDTGVRSQVRYYRKLP